MMIPPPPPNPIAATLAAIAALDPEAAEFIRQAINANARLYRTGQRGLLTNRAILFSHIDRLIPKLAGHLRTAEALANRRYQSYHNKRRELEMLQQRLRVNQAKFGPTHEKTRAVLKQLDATIQQLAAA
ncbi:hypothetical protein [Herpetosiphon geysericola]|uniref:Uncharacterized protein n=1 Tax=Herpetosiphon geysericola TaxID=70996 RepID=A0A0P6YLD6_9CHLR|nr:hypothetical protein [Herpetosiphon geysericola]KPL90776.1 hypothetical protein SE18_05260 [Herpetosiphon geysericola]